VVLALGEKDKGELIFYVAEFVQDTESCVEEVRGQTAEVFVAVSVEDSGAHSDELSCLKGNQTTKAFAEGYWLDSWTVPSHYKPLTS
jgi:hypothetical protein